jgi:hypothetical protein
MTSASTFDRWLESLRAAPLFGLGRRFMADRDLLLEAEELAEDRQFDRALNVAKQLIISLKEPVALWQYPWRQWQIRPLFDRIDPQVIYWRQVVADYQQALQNAQQIGYRDLGRAESMVRQAISIYPHRQGAALLKEIQRLQQGKEWFRLGLAAELTGEIATARYHYQNIQAEFPKLQKTCQQRLTALAIADRNWAEAFSLSKDLGDKLSAHYNGLAQYQLNQDLRLTVLRLVQSYLQKGRLEEAWQEITEHLEDGNNDNLLQRLINEYIEPQFAAIPADWPGRFQFAQNRWLKTGGRGILHDWAVAAYYRYLSEPDRLDWLQELLPIWFTASMNINPNLPNAKAIASQIRDLVSTTIDRLPDEDTKKDFQLQWQREMTALKYLGTPPTSGLRIQGVFLSPGFYELFQSQIKTVQLPDKIWAMFYTPWWQAAIACLQGNPVQAMSVKPAIDPDAEAITGASKFAQQFVAYHEGCYYLQCKPGGFPRWREAFPVLEIAKEQILKSPEWRLKVDQLCDEHHSLIWDVLDKKTFSRYWYSLLHTNTALEFMNFMASNDDY